MGIKNGDARRAGRSSRGSEARVLPVAGLPDPQDPSLLMPFLWRLLPRWISFWVESDLSLSGRRRALPAPAGLVPFHGLSESEKWHARGLIGRRADKTVGDAIAALYRAGFSREWVSVLYALADAFEPKRWRNDAKVTVSKVHGVAKRARDMASQAGAPAAVIEALEGWRVTLATFVGVAYFPESRDGTRAPHGLRTAARRLLLRHGVSPSHIAAIELAWLVPVGVPSFEPCPERPSQYPLKPGLYERDTIKVLRAGKPFAIWHHLRLDGEGNPEWVATARDALSKDCDHCARETVSGNRGR